MKLTKIALGVSLGLSGLVSHASDVLLFPYVVKSPSVTTIVNVIDIGSTATYRYDDSGNASTGTGYNKLHWRLHYKSGTTAVPSKTAACSETNRYLPTSANDIQSVDLGGHFGASSKGVLFNDPGVLNNWHGALGTGYALMSLPTIAQGVLFVHNADIATAVAGTPTMRGDAMVFEFANGAAWGYSAMAHDNDTTAANASDFDFDGAATATGSVVTFMPTSEVTTRLFVTPLDSTATTTAVSAPTTMLGANGAAITGWNTMTTSVTLTTGGTGVAYDRDEHLVSGAVPVSVTCVGSVDVADMIDPLTFADLADGGYGQLAISAPTISATVPVTTDKAAVIKLEFSAGGTFNGVTQTGSFNNAFRL